MGNVVRNDIEEAIRKDFPNVRRSDIDINTETQTVKVWHKATNPEAKGYQSGLGNTFYKYDVLEKVTTTVRKDGTKKVFSLYKGIKLSHAGSRFY